MTPLDARAADVMKFVVSGGVSKVDDEGNDPGDPARPLLDASAMNMLRSLLSIVALCLAAVSAVGQTTVAQVSSYPFQRWRPPHASASSSKGTDTKYVESYWKDELKKISAAVSNKKEVIGAGA